MEKWGQALLDERMFLCHFPPTCFFLNFSSDKSEIQLD
jgi:hypothetical protein